MPSNSSLVALEQLLRAQALAYPEVAEEFPWGERAIKVRGKTFLFMRLGDSDLTFSVKLPRTGVQALALPFVKPTEYGLGRHGWVTVRASARTRELERQYVEWIDESFRAVAPKRLVAQLDSPDEPTRTAAKRSAAKRASGKRR